MSEHDTPAAGAARVLAFDTSTERMSVALSDGTRQWQHEGPGAAQSSATLIPAIFTLLAEAGLTLPDLDAIAFGRGPGSFTGLRTACAVAQGLALGAHLPVLPIDTLLAVAEEARHRHPQQSGGELAAAAPNAPNAREAPADDLCIMALLDARMDEMYAQEWRFAHGRWRAEAPCQLVRPEQLQWPAASVSGASVAAGNVFAAYSGRLSALPPAWHQADVLPTAAALLRLAPALLAGGQAVDAAHALPLYIRDKVALTTEERALAKAAAAAAEAPDR